MSKNIFITLFAAALLFTGCGKDKITEVTSVKVHVNDFSISQEEFSTKASPASYSGVKAMTLAFYDGTTEVYKTTQYKDTASTYTTFGEFDLTLPMGSYTMVVLGYVLYDDDELTLTSPTQAEYTVGSPRETFAATQEVNITSTSAVELSATLNRIVAQLKVISTDNRTANVEKVRMTFAAGGKRFSPTSGLATVNTGSVSTVSTSVAVGERSGSIGYVFLATDEQTIDVTIETLDSDGNTIYTKTVNNVPFKRNRRTKLTGAMYTNSSVAGTFQLDTVWNTDYTDTF